MRTAANCWTVVRVCLVPIYIYIFFLFLYESLIIRRKAVFTKCWLSLSRAVIIVMVFHFIFLARSCCSSRSLKALLQKSMVFIKLLFCEVTVHFFSFKLLVFCVQISLFGYLAHIHAKGYALLFGKRSELYGYNAVF